MDKLRAKEYYQKEPKETKNYKAGVIIVTYYHLDIEICNKYA